MKRINRNLLAAALMLALCTHFAQISLAINLVPGSLLGVDAANYELVNYSFGGSILNTLPLTGLPSTPIGVAVIGNRVWVGGVSGDIGEVNLSNGAVFNVFNGFSNEAIGDNGTNILAYNYSDGMMREFTPGGALVNTVQLPSGGTGIDGTSSRIYLGMYSNNGNIQVHNTAGGLLNTIVTSLPSNSVSALGLDRSNDTLWVATGFGDHRLRKFDLNGNLLANFPTSKPWINGLDVVPVPEPTTAALLLCCALPLALRRSRIVTAR